MSSAHKSPIRSHHQRRNYRHHHANNPAPPIPSVNIFNSSLGTLSSGSTGVSNAPKKKFGKNLNKLVKQQQQPSAPPPIQGSSRGGGVASSGLLLLSTKGTKKSVTSSTSTHEALVSVLNGGEVGGGKTITKVASGVNRLSDRDGQSTTGKKEKMGAVWGKTATTAASSLTTSARDKSQPDVISGSKTPVNREEEKSSRQNLDLNRYLRNNQSEISKEMQNGKNKDLHNKSDAMSTGKYTQATHDQQPESASMNTTPIPTFKPVPTEITATKASVPVSSKEETMNSQEDQVEFMKKLAKERAEKRRKEEEARIQEQKERAAARLKELELKMNLGKKNSKGINENPTGTVINVAKKKLYDPSRSYSSLLGGGNGVMNESVNNTNSNSSPRISSDPPKIQFSSYEDRDRGARGPSSGPRMLFDPKSGSMVAAPSRDIGSTSSRGRKEKKKSRSGKDHDDPHDEADARPSRHRNKRESGLRKHKHKESNEEKVSNEVATIKSRKGTLRRTRTLPRTCGVLYKRDRTGQIVSADGCEGDQGYGAHSVPGGRVRNPKSFAVFKQRLRFEEKQYRNANDIMYGNHGYTGLHAHQQYAGFVTPNGDYDYTSEWQNNGLNRSHFMRKSQQAKTDAQEDFSENRDNELPTSLRVKGDEKLDLFTDLEASPKLQASAAVWAPSEAVLALATANGKKEENEVNDSESDSNIEISESAVYAQSAMALVDNESSKLADEIEASPSIGLGLGFDPTKDMDTMMMSPTIDFEKSEKESNLPGLALEDSSSIPLATKNPFVNSSGFLGSSTWGAANSNSMGSLSNWDYLGSGGGGSNGSTHKVNRQSEDASSSFLSLNNALGSQTTWGSSSGFTGGLNGINSPSTGNTD